MRLAPLALLLCPLALAGCLGGGDRGTTPRAPEPLADATVSVRLDEPVQTRGSMNGFLHSLGPTTPADDRIAPLQPRLWRSDLRRAPLDRAERFGALYHVVISDFWGYPKDNWYGRRPPWEDLKGWRAMVRDLARRYRGRNVVWDIWNEPNGPNFWAGGQQRFFRVYSEANRVLREELGPDVEIAGPSIDKYSPEYLLRFLDYCRRKRCRVSILVWHELLEPYQPMRSIIEHLVEARAGFVQNPRFRSLGLREIHINEYMGLSDRYFPAETVSYLEALERGSANRAARSCWTEPECLPAELTGTLAPDGTPRSAWWVHRWYAEGAAARVASTSSTDTVAALASAAGGSAQVLLGHVPLRAGAPAAPRPGSTGAGTSAQSGTRAASPAEAATDGGSDDAAPSRVRLELTGLPQSLRAAGRLRVVARRVPSVGARPVPRPRTDLDEVVEVRRGGLGVTLPPLGAHEALQVTVTARR